MKKFPMLIVLPSLLTFLVLVGCSSNTTTENLEQEVYQQTLTISKEYASLRYQTDNILINTKKYSDYDIWNDQLVLIIKKWEKLEIQASSLEKLATKMANGKESISFIPKVSAYTKEEVSNIVDKAPFGKKIITLAKHLGVDAKMAQLILNETQALVSREAFGEEGDTAETFENAAITIKNASKVTVFVGTIAISAPVGALAKTAVIVAGADLTLEITDDTAKMALGNKNKISSIVGDARKITEPAAAILSIATLPSNLVKGVDKLNAVVFGADQINSAIQAGSIIGIKLPTYSTKEDTKSTVSVLTQDEINEWVKENTINQEAETKESVEKILGIEEKSEIFEKKDESNETAKNESKLMPVNEFEELFNNFEIENISDVKKIFGEPDTVNTLEDGYGNFVYHRRLIYPNGNIAGMMIRFQNLEVGGYSIMME